MEVVCKNENTDRRNQPEKKKNCVGDAYAAQNNNIYIYPYGQKNIHKEKENRHWGPRTSEVKCKLP